MNLPMSLIDFFQNYPTIHQYALKGAELIQHLHAKEIAAIYKEAASAFISLGTLAKDEYSSIQNHVQQHEPTTDDEAKRIGKISLCFFVLQPVLRFTPFIGPVAPAILSNTCGMLACATQVHSLMAQKSHKALQIGYTGSALSLALLILKNGVDHSALTTAAACLGGVGIVWLTIGYSVMIYDQKEDIWDMAEKTYSYIFR